MDDTTATDSPPAGENVLHDLVKSFARVKDAVFSSPSSTTTSADAQSDASSEGQAALRSRFTRELSRSEEDLLDAVVSAASSDTDTEESRASGANSGARAESSTSTTSATSPSPSPSPSPSTSVKKPDAKDSILLSHQDDIANVAASALEQNEIRRKASLQQPSFAVNALAKFGLLRKLQQQSGEPQPPSLSDTSASRASLLSTASASAEFSSAPVGSVGPVGPVIAQQPATSVDGNAGLPLGANEGEFDQDDEDDDFQIIHQAEIMQTCPTGVDVDTSSIATSISSLSSSISSSLSNILPTLKAVGSGASPSPPLSFQQRSASSFSSSASGSGEAQSTNSHTWRKIREYKGSLADYLKTVHIQHSPKDSTAWTATESLHIMTLLDDMSATAMDNVGYFKAEEKKAAANGNSFLPGRPKPASIEKFEMLFVRVHATVSAIRHDLFSLCWIAPLFDFDETIRANGYRSLSRVVTACLSKLAKEMHEFTAGREALLFRLDASYMKMQEYLKILEMLSAMLSLSISMAQLSDTNSVFPGDATCSSTPISATVLAGTDSLLAEVESLRNDYFYGKKFGFQYSKPMRNALRIVLIAMASYSYGFNNHNHEFVQKALSLASSPLYVFGSEDRAKSLSAQLLKGDLAFSKAFWNLTENTMAKHVSKVVSASVSVNTLLSLKVTPLICPSDPSLPGSLADDPVPEPGAIEEYIPPVSPASPPVPSPSLSAQPPSLPTPHIASSKGAFVHLSRKVLTAGLFNDVTARLISYNWLQGQVYDADHLTTHGHKEDHFFSRPKPAVKGLIVHFHGGGFISQSSKSHEIYLREWAKELEVPILSVDYSLAPEHPYPKALYECFYAYVWALTHAESLGTTAERVVLAGDSAGANLCLAVALKCVEHGIRRPDGIMAAYAPCLVQYWPSASRLLSVMDALLPAAVLRNCLSAYVGSNQAKPMSKRPSTTGSESPEDASAHGKVVLTDAGRSVVVPAKTAHAALNTVNDEAKKASAAATNDASAVPASPTSPAAPPVAGWCMDPFVSPLVAPESMLRRLPPIQLVAAGLDPLLDDSIQFAARLRRVGHDVKLHVFDTLPHGFLSFSKLVDEAEAASRFCSQYMATVLKP